MPTSNRPKTQPELTHPGPVSEPAAIITQDTEIRKIDLTVFATLSGQARPRTGDRAYPPVRTDIQSKTSRTRRGDSVLGRLAAYERRPSSQFQISRSSAESTC